MIPKLRTERDSQQWTLDLALNMRGRVQNFEADGMEVPSRAQAKGYFKINSCNLIASNLVKGTTPSLCTAN